MLYGREAERSAMAALLGDARVGRSATVVLRGEAGSGKSSLLDEVRTEATGMRVLRAQGVESESELPFAALHQLLRPVLPRLSDLAAPQADALRSALGLGPGAVPNRFLVSVATLSLLAEAAESTPILCTVDDAQWLDEASAEALLFAGRRLEAERIAMVFAVREGDARRFDAPGITEHRLCELDLAAVAQLLADAAGTPVSRAVAERLAAETAGNPLALVELASELTSAQLAAREPMPEPLPLTGGVEQAFLDRVRRLPVETQRMLVVAAANDTGRLTVVFEAASELGYEPGSLAPAESSGLVRIAPPRLEFRHPLVRSAIYQSAPFEERQAAHRALAQALDPLAEADRRVWHQAAAAVGPDSAIGVDLERAARRAAERGAMAAAASGLERAADLSTDDLTRGRRLTAAAQNAWLAGRLAHAAALLSRARPLIEDRSLLADIDKLRGTIELGGGDPQTACRILLEGAREILDVDASKCLEMLVRAGEAASLAADSEATREIARVAAGIGPSPDARDELHRATVAGFGQFFAGAADAAIREFKRAVSLADELSDEEALLSAGRAALYLGDDDAFYRFHDEVVRTTRTRGLVGDLPLAGQRLGLAELLTGRWVAATATLSETARLATDTAQEDLAVLPLAWLALLAALRGDASSFHASATEASTTAQARRHGAGEDGVRWAEGVVDLGKGRTADAAARLDAISHPGVVMLCSLDRIEALAASGRSDRAREALEPLAVFAERSSAPWALGRVAHCRALLDESSAEDHFRLAQKAHARSGRPFERARTELAFGEFLRRRRRRIDSREHLSSALKTFELLGAVPWADRARAELRASGQRARRREPSTLDDLTPQELQIARFVVEGLSNREVAARLFLSRRTVEFHLRNVFVKLGVTARTQLASFQFEEPIGVTT